MINFYDNFSDYHQEVSHNLCLCDPAKTVDCIMIVDGTQITDVVASMLYALGFWPVLDYTDSRGGGGCQDIWSGECGAVDDLPTNLASDFGYFDKSQVPTIHRNSIL